MLLPGTLSIPEMGGVPPPVATKRVAIVSVKKKGEPAARNVEKSFRLAFPNGSSPNRASQESLQPHTISANREANSIPEGDQKGERQKENGREDGHPDIQTGKSSAGLVGERCRRR